MISKNKRNAIKTIDYEPVVYFLQKHGWHEDSLIADCAIWKKDHWMDEESNNLLDVKRVHEVQLMLLYNTDYGDYGRRMLEVFADLSIIYDKCECVLYDEMVNDYFDNKK